MRQEITKKILHDFEEFLVESEKSENTITKYIRDIVAFDKYVQGRSIDRILVLEYKAYLKSKYALSSANSKIAAMNTFFRYMNREDLCMKQYKVQRKIFCSEHRELSKEEYRALIYAAERRKDQRLSLLIQTICGTGIRVSELEYITVEAAKTGEGIVNCKGKSRNVFIVPALREKLLDYAKSQGTKTGAIFVTRTGKAVNRSNIWNQMKKLCKEANVEPEKVFPHNLRHLFASTFYDIEKDISKLADILGHNNVNTTRIYIISTGMEHRIKMEKMDLIV